MNEKDAKRFRTFMTAIDDDLLEEARATERKNSNVLYFRAAVAACLVLVLLIPTTHFYKNTASLRMLSDMGYVLALPASASDIRYDIVQYFGEPAAQAVFVKDNIEYTCYGVKGESPKTLEDGIEFSWCGFANDTNAGHYYCKLVSCGRTDAMDAHCLC